jgi:diaminopimelate epimerase
MDAPEEASRYSLRVEGVHLEIGAVSMGNPHAVVQVSDVKTAPLDRFGPSIEHHERFPKRTNVGFMQIVDRGHIRLRVFERGVGETLACGTGACAAVAVGRRQGLLDDDVRVDLPGGTATVSSAAEDEHLWLTGPATTVFSGSIDL